MELIFLIAFILTLFAIISCSSAQLADSRSAHHSHLHHSRGNRIVNLELAMLEQIGLKKLEASLAAYRNMTELWGTTVFHDIEVTYRTSLDFIHGTDGKGEHQKYFVGKNAIKRLGKEFIVYAAGIDNRPVFENYMASELNASVFAFDCTNQNKPEWTQFSFHSWCIGAPKDLSASSYAAKSQSKNFTFLTLGEIKRKLNHSHIDMLKMDIEGCEWDVLKGMLAAPDEDLPGQLLFELHTENANAYWVPPEIVKGYGRRQVTQLIYDLYMRNYRVMNIEINAGDLHCAEISLIKIK